MKTMTTNSYVRESPGFPFILRVLWFIFIGWHVTLLVDAGRVVAEPDHHRHAVGAVDAQPCAACVDAAHAAHATRWAKHATDEVVEWRTQGIAADPFVLRAIYFVLIGWWFSLLWSLLAWLLCVTIIGLPLGVLMFNRLPESQH